MRTLKAELPPPSSNRAELLFANACAFWNAFCIIGNDLGRKGNLTLVGPLWVNLAFAAELYFKFLLSVNTGQIAKVHDLHKLFMLLPQDVRNDLTEQYEREISESKFYRTLSPLWQRQDLGIVKVLSSAAKTFEVWRYPGEGIPLNAPGSLQLVMKATQKHILEKHPRYFSSLDAPLEECHLSIYGGINE